MITQENACYKNELWCVYELKDAQGNYYEETRLKMRKASQNNEFVCPDCGEYLVLCAGNKVEPYFRHHENANCPVRTNGQGSRHLLARRLLFQAAKRSFPNAEITCSRQGGKYISDIFIKDGNMKMVLEYAGQDVKLELWEKKHAYYKEEGIMDLWFLNGKKYADDVLATFEYLIYSNQGIILLLDMEDQEIRLKQRCTIPFNQSERVFTKSFKLEEITIDPSGKINCPFETCKNQFIEDVEEILKSKKRAYQYNADSGIFDKNPYREREAEKESVQKIVQKSGEVIEVNREYKRLHMEAVKEREIRRDGGKNFEKDGTPRQGTLDDKLHRRSLTSKDGPLTVRMTAIGESWDLPQLKGNEAMLPKASTNRKSYLESLNLKLQNIQDRKKQELLISKSIEKINSELKIYSWHCYKRG